MLFTGGAEARVVEGGGEAYTQGGRAPRGMSYTAPYCRQGSWLCCKVYCTSYPALKTATKSCLT